MTLTKDKGSLQLYCRTYVSKDNLPFCSDLDHCICPVGEYIIKMLANNTDPEQTIWAVWSIHTQLSRVFCPNIWGKFNNQTSEYDNSVCQTWYEWSKQVIVCSQKWHKHHNFLPGPQNHCPLHPAVHLVHLTPTLLFSGEKYKYIKIININRTKFNVVLFSGEKYKYIKNININRINVVNYLIIPQEFCGMQCLAHKIEIPYKFYVLGQIGLSKQCRPRSDCFWRSSLIRVYAVCHSISIFWMHYCNVTSNFSIFRRIMAIVWGVPNFRIFTVNQKTWGKVYAATDRNTIPYILAIRQGFSPSRMTTNNLISPMKFCYNTNCTLPQQTQRSRSLL